MKKVVILWHNGGRLANQLWLYISVFAYCLERGYELDNYCFFAYADHFNLPAPSQTTIDRLFYQTYRFFLPLKKITDLLSTRLYSYPFNKSYKTYLKLSGLDKRTSLADQDDKVICLPPSSDVDKRIEEFDQQAEGSLYLQGWLFRNPVGIIKYRRQIIDYFQPRQKYRAAADKFIKDLRIRYKNIIGVHIRQTDYAQSFRAGRLYFSAEETAVLMKEFLSRYRLTSAETCFIICSDDKIDRAKLAGLNIAVSENEPLTDLLILASTDKIIGSDSTFGAFASYYGDKTLIVFQKDGIDWDYYEDKDGFFYNKYLTTARWQK